MVAPLRIAHVSATFPPYLGGAGTTCFELAHELALRGHEVDVFTADAAGEAPPCAATVHRIEPLAAIGNAPLLPRIARLNGFDVVHLHYPFIFGTELVLASQARHRHRRPLVVSYHNELVGEGRRRALFWGYEATWGRALIACADRVCVVSEAHAQTVRSLRAARRRDPAKLVEIPNGVDIHTFRPGPDSEGVRARAGIPADAVVAAFVATLDRAHYLKRCDRAIEALARAADERLHLLVVGGGEWLGRYQRLARQAGVADRVHFMGAVQHDRLPSILRAADFLLLTSDLESFGIVLIEAMACGLPAVATDLPGVRATVRDGETALLAPAGDSHAIAARISELLAIDGAARTRMGAAGRALCERAYAWSIVVDRLEQVYADVAVN
jgi:glycosyltransferase involved in cell wall biosynthesis